MPMATKRAKVRAGSVRAGVRASTGLIVVGIVETVTVDLLRQLMSRFRV